MSRDSAVASSPPVTGITRDCDLILDTVTANREAGQAYSTVRNLRTGVSGSGNQNIGVVQSSCISAIKYGMSVPNVTSGLGNGACIQYGISVQTDAVLISTNASAFATRRGVTRILSTMFTDSLQTPNNDVGMQVVIGGASLAQLLPATGGGVGKVGFGIWMLSSTGWNWATKRAADAANTLSDVVLLKDINGVAIDVTVPTLVEMRIYDSVGGPASAKNNAHIDLLINGNVFLTRYWTNPPGVVTTVLPPLIAPIYPQLRNTSTGPANAYFGDFCLIHGPNNEGTTSDT